MEETIERKRAVVDLSDLANTLNIESELKSLLNETEDNTTCMWYLICILDGMDKNDLLELAESNVGKIQDARSSFLKKKYQVDSGLVTQVANLKEEVKVVVKESKEVRTSIEEGIDKMLSEQLKNVERLVMAKEEIVEMQKRQIIELERKNKRLEEQKTKSSDEEMRELLEQIKENGRVPNFETQKETGQAEAVPNFGTVFEIEQEESAMGFVPFEEQKQIEDVPNFGTVEETEKEKGKKRNRFAVYLAKLDTKRFIERYLDKEDISEEQKEFFLECFEAGMSVKEIEEFASQNLSVPMMRRLKNILEKNRGKKEWI